MHCLRENQNISAENLSEDVNVYRIREDAAPKKTGGQDNRMDTGEVSQRGILHQTCLQYRNREEWKRCVPRLLHLP